MRSGGVSPSNTRGLLAERWPPSAAPPLRDRKFADSPLEESGFELVVPLTTDTFQNFCFDAAGCIPSEDRSAPARGETDGSNPSTSTEELCRPILDTDQRKAVPLIREDLGRQLSGSFRIRRHNKRLRMIPGPDFALHHPKHRPSQ